MTRKYGNLKALRTAVVIVLVVQCVLGSVSITAANTVGIFRTRVSSMPGAMPGPVAIPLGNSVDLVGALNVAPFRRIRVCAKSQGSVSPIRVSLLIIQDNDQFAELEAIVIPPNSMRTVVFDVPGMVLRIKAQSATAPGSTARSNNLNMVIYGSD